MITKYPSAVMSVHRSEYICETQKDDQGLCAWIETAQCMNVKCTSSAKKYVLCNYCTMLEKKVMEQILKNFICVLLEGIISNS